MKVLNYWLKFKPVKNYWHYSYGTALLIISILSLVLNSLVLTFIFKRKKRRQRTSTYFMVNLIIFDILKSTFNVPMTIISSFYGKWVFGSLGCDFFGFTSAFLGFVSINTMVLMTIERYICIKNPFNALKISSKVCIVSQIISWIYCALLSTLPLFTDERFVLEGFLTSCSFDVTTKDQRTRFLITAMFFGGFFIPLCMIITFYGLIWYKLNSDYKNLGFPGMSGVNFNNNSIRRHNTKVVNHQMRLLKNEVKLLTMEQSTPLKNRVNNIKNSILTRNFLKRELRVIRTVMLFVSMFCFAWVPYAIIAIYGQYGNNIQYFLNPYSSSVPFVLAKLSSVYNPIIYLVLNKDCRLFLKTSFMNIRKSNKDHRNAIFYI